MIRKYKMTKSGRLGTRYSEEFKRALIEEYLNGNANKRTLLDKYDVRAKGVFLPWMRELGYVDLRRVSAEVSRTIRQPMSKPANTDDPTSALRSRIAQLERELEDEKLRSEAYARLIELAEREQGISIRKKDNTK
ncbi:MAG: hypothetical protein WBO28_13275 [Flavobacteriales bacterium]